MAKAFPAPHGAVPGQPQKQPSPAGLGPGELGRHKAPRERRRWLKKGFQSARAGAGAHPEQALLEKLKYQGLLKVENFLPTQERIKEMQTTEVQGSPGLWSLMLGQYQGLPPQGAAPCRANAPPPPLGPSASLRAISRVSQSPPQWPPSSTGFRRTRNLAPSLRPAGSLMATPAALVGLRRASPVQTRG